MTTLEFPPFADNVQLWQAFYNNPALRRGMSGSGVALIQGALIDLEYPLPVSTRKTGKPDGIYGSETAAMVEKYQRDRKLTGKLGVVGNETLSALDVEMNYVVHPGTKSPPIRRVPLLPRYVVGTGDPSYSPDAGAGPWNSKPKLMTYEALRTGILDNLHMATTTVGDDAVAHLRHYLHNSGTRYTIDLEGMVNEVRSAKRRYEREVEQFQAFVETLSPGTYDVMSVNVDLGYNDESESANWYFAIGGYATWGSGHVVVSESGGKKTFEADFEYKFRDRYNWDAGKYVMIGPIKVTDKFMGEFHRQGLAREFDCVGYFRRRFLWTQGDPLVSPGL